MARSMAVPTVGGALVPNNAPVNKVTYGALAGALSVIIVYVINTYVTPTKPLPSEVSSAFTTILSFIVSYFVPPAASERIE
jgi:hypothetical protein